MKLHLTNFTFQFSYEIECCNICAECDSYQLFLAYFHHPNALKEKLLSLCSKSHEWLPTRKTKEKETQIITDLPYILLIEGNDKSKQKQY